MGSGEDSSRAHQTQTEVSSIQKDRASSSQSPVLVEMPESHTVEELPKGKTQSFIPAAKKFAGLSLEDLYVIELCAGSARLSKVARDNGFRTMAVDHSNARTCGFPICNFDLSNDNDLEELSQFIEAAADSILMIWIAPSCGTCSRAREKRLPQAERLGLKVPVPLRSNSQPDQLDGLSGLDKLKVEKANLLYAGVYKLAALACRSNIFLVIENPTNSHYWNTADIKQLSSEFKHHYVTFHNCAHGGDRDKLTSLWVTENWLDELAILCDKSHDHKPWSASIQADSLRFATSEEAAYPWLLCERVIHCIQAQAISLGAQAPTTLDEQALGPQSDRLNRLVLGALPRGQKVKPLVAEFGHFVTVYSDPQRPQLLDNYVKQLPKGAKLTSRRLLKRGDIQATEDQIFLELGNAENIEKSCIGVPTEPDEFIQRAIKAGHPRSLDQFLDPIIANMLKANFIDDPSVLAKKRCDFFKKYLKRAVALNAGEEDLRKNMPPYVRELVGNKRLLLWEEMLNDIGYPDTTLIKEIASGFRLSGWMAKSFVFKPRTKRPSMSMETLKKLAKGMNLSTLRSMDTRQEEAVEESTWNETLEEEQKRWIWFDNDLESDVFVLIGRRFGLVQSDKTRVIDDCSCCGLNWTVGLYEKFHLQSIDILAAMLSSSFKECPNPDFPKIFGRCYDLKSAYKQFAIHPEDRAILRMAVNRPQSDTPQLIGFNALPFGAVGSVSGFLRVSMATWYIGIFALQTCWTAFYDDFSVISREELLDNTAWCVESLFQLLGLKYATEGKKFKPFNTRFKMLGLEVNLESCEKKQFLIGHTPERQSELLEKIDNVLSSGKIDSKEAERLRGRMLFFESYAYGRIANAAIKNLGKVCTGPGGSRKIDTSLEYSLLSLRNRVLTAPPLTIGVPLCQTWIVFTDGACNPELRQGSIGGMIIDPFGECKSFFSSQVPDDVMLSFLRVSGNPIHELEVLPVYVACLLWGSRFRHSLIVYYIDNESARMAYVRGSGDTVFASKIIHDFVTLESEMQHKTWFGRCPSRSNPSDGASRLELSWFEERCIERTNICWELLRHHLGLIGETTGGS